jgi:hypothetical protein
MRWTAITGAAWTHPRRYFAKPHAKGENMSPTKLTGTILVILGSLSVALAAAVDAQSPDPIMVDQLVELDRAVDFRSTKRALVAVPAARYVVAGVGESLLLVDVEASREFAISAIPGAHELALVDPAATSVSSLPDLPDAHVLDLSSIDGSRTTAVGSYSGVQLRGIPDMSQVTQQVDFQGLVRKGADAQSTSQELVAAYLDPESGADFDPLSNTIVIGKPVHFSGAESEDVLVPAGSYWASPGGAPSRMIGAAELASVATGQAAGPGRVESTATDSSAPVTGPVCCNNASTPQPVNG